MKKIFLFPLLILTLALILTACGGEETKPKATDEPTALQPTETPTEGATQPPEDVPSVPTPAISLSLDNETSRAGKVTFTLAFTDLESDVTLLYADKAGNPLRGYTPIAVFDAEEEKATVTFIVPHEAISILAVNEETSCRAEIPAVYRLADGEFFAFGAISDVHYNRYFDENGVDVAFTSFPLALDYFEKKNVDFVGIAGDLSVDGEKDAFEKFNAAIAPYVYPVYTVAGNHDVDAVQDKRWENNINTGIKDDAEVISIASNNYDFVYAPADLDGDVFIFLSQSKAQYNTATARLLSDEQLDWLEAELAKYTDRTVYLFFHTFLCGPDGEWHTGVGNIKNPGGYTYNLPYTFGNADEVRFRALLTENKNVIWFSGHSHWTFEMEIYGDWANFSNYDGEFAYCVHVPSVTEPRTIGENDEKRTGLDGESSQGWLLYDYGDAVLLLPINFMTGTVHTEYMEIIFTK